MNHTGENVGTRGPPQVELRVCELGERLKLLKTIINLQRCLSLLWIKNGKKIPGIQVWCPGMKWSFKSLVFSLVVKLCDSTHLSFSYSLLFAWFCIEELVILPTIKKIQVIIQWITTAEFRHLSAQTNTILCCECVIGLNE